MVHPGRGLHNLEFALRLNTKALGIAPGVDAAMRPDDADLQGVPAGIGAHIIVGSIKVTVVQEQPFDFGAVQGFFHGLAKGRQAVFVKDLIALDIHRPIRFSRNSGQGLVGFDGQDSTPIAQAIVPFGVQDPNTGIVQTLDQLQRIVFGLSDRNNDFIAKGKNRTKGFQNRIIQENRVANKGKTADFQKNILILPKAFEDIPQAKAQAKAR